MAEEYLETKDNATEAISDSISNDNKEDFALGMLQKIIVDNDSKKVDIPEKKTDYKEIVAYHNVSAKIKSDEKYIAVVQNVVEFSKKNLTKMSEDKYELREQLISFFTTVLGIQLAMLLVFILLSAVSKSFEVSDKVLIAFMTSIFVETLGAIIVMIKYAFKSSEETEIIKVLNAIVKNYQKYKSNDVGNDVE